MIVSYVLIGLCFILFAIVSFDLIKLFTKKRRRDSDANVEEVLDNQTVDADVDNSSV
jgi:hypothetical protein